MRSSLPITLFSLLLPTLAASATTSQCLNSKAKVLAIESLCGDKRHLISCFQKASEGELESTIEDCLTKAGCTEKAAAGEASYLASFCDGEPSDLKRRERDALAARDTATTAASADSTTTTDASSTATTTTGSVSKRTTADTTATSTTAATTTATGTTATTTGTTTSALTCSTASVTTVSSCDATNQYDCSMVETTTMVCQASLYCDQDSAGNDLCMVRQDGMTLSGTIVCIFLAVVLTAIIGSVVFLCCQDRREQKRIRARAEAAAIAKSNTIEQPAPTRSVSQSTAAAAPGQANPFAG